MINSRVSSIFPRRAMTVTATLAAAALLTSCATLPRDSAPQALRPFDSASDVPLELGPTMDRESDLLLRDFYTASAHPTGGYTAARSYLTPEAEQEWNPEAGPLIVDRLNITAAADAESDERAFRVRGRIVGQLDSNSAYQPRNASYDATIVMHQVNGQWRISSLPEEIVIEQADLLNNYEPHDLYFYNQTGRTLIPDRRWVWVYGGEQSLDTVLISMLMDGPSEKISPAVNPVATGEPEFIGREDGVYEFTGFQDLDPQQRLRFGAQLTWTLAYAGVPQPYNVLVDGAPVAEGYEELTPEDFADLNPRVTTSDSAPLYAVSDGEVLSVASSEAEPVAGDLGSMGEIASADITLEGGAVAVRREGESERALLAGDIDGEMQEVLRAESITRPSFERLGNSAWAVADGENIVRIIRSGASGEFVEAGVDAGAMEDIEGTISELQLSPTGSRVAMIVDGRLYVGVITAPDAGSRAIVNVDEVAAELGGSALSVEWNPDGSLVVGTASPESPIWRVELDGSAVTTLPASNISAPVVAVAASSTTLYATDELAIRQLPVSGTTSGTDWRDVPGLRGVRSAPIVAH